MVAAPCRIITFCGDLACALVVLGYYLQVSRCAGADETLMGLDIALACLTEAPIFFFAGAIVEKLGVNRALNISAVAFAARCLVSLHILPQTCKI